MTDMPRGWATAEIGDLLHGIVAGKNLKCEERPPQAHERGVIKVSAVTWGTFDASQSKTFPRSFKPAPDTAIKAGDFLFSRANTLELVGAVVMVKNDHPNLFLSDKVLRLDLSPDLKPWLLVYLRSLEGRRKLSAVSSGNQMSMRNIGQSSLKSVSIPLPPLNEQHRIVEKIETLFDEIDKGVESLQTARTTLGLYRQSLLKSAFEGRLTAVWRAQNADKLEDPKTLLARIQTERETRYKAALDTWQEALAQWRANGEKGKKPAKPKRPRDIPAKALDIGIPGWTIVPLGLLIEEPAYGTSKKSDYDGGEKGVLRIPNIAAGVIDSTDLKSSDFDKVELERYRLVEGDVLTIRSNGSLSLVGKPALVRSIDTQFVYAGYLIRLRPVPGSLIPKNLVNLMIEPNVRAQIEGKAKSTSGVNNINSKELQELRVPICSPSEQTEITRILDARLDAAARLEAEIDAALTRAGALRQSILKKAFSGHLVPQEPADEPAGALLVRIKAARAMAPKATRKRKATA